MRLWVMNHYRVLPTEKRFLDLTPNQIEILFVSGIGLPHESGLRRAYADLREAEQKATSLPSEILRQQGYSEDEIREMQEALRNHV